MLNKKGQDISITTIILVILGIAVLVLLILGFTKGWSNIAPWLSGNNVDTIKTQCQASCATNSKYEFCTAVKTVNDGKDKFETTCNELAIGTEITEKGNVAYSTYGIEDCPSITC